MGGFWGLQCLSNPLPRCHREQRVVYLGDKNALNLTFHARNRGEGGAYEAELCVTLPPEAEYSGIIRDHVVGGGITGCRDLWADGRREGPCSPSRQWSQRALAPGPVAWHMLGGQCPGPPSPHLTASLPPRTSPA